MRSSLVVLMVLMIAMAVFGWRWAVAPEHAESIAPSSPSSASKTVPASKAAAKAPVTVGDAEPRWMSITKIRERWQLAVKEQEDGLAMLEYCRTEGTGTVSLWCAQESTKSCFQYPGRGPGKVAELEKAIRDREGQPTADASRMHLRWCRRIWLADPAVVGSAAERLRQLLAQGHPAAVVEQIVGHAGDDFLAIDAQGAERLRSAWRSGDPDVIRQLVRHCLPPEVSSWQSTGLWLELIDCRLRGNCEQMPAVTRANCQKAEFMAWCPPESSHYENWLSQQMSFEEYRQAAAFADGMMSALRAADTRWPALEQCLGLGKAGPSG